MLKDARRVARCATRLEVCRARLQADEAACCGPPFLRFVLVALRVNPDPIVIFVST